jgi:hypothetical protein
MSVFRPRLVPLLIPFALTAAGAGCTETLAPAPDPGPVLFEVEYVNAAWGFSWHGFTVDTEGRVHSYDLGDLNQLPQHEDEVFTAGELEAKYAHNRRLETSVSAEEAAAKYARVGEVLAGSTSEPVGLCADAGTTRYSALIYAPATDTYHRVLLHQRGDVARANTSAAARELYLWLAQVTSTADGVGVCDTAD